MKKIYITFIFISFLYLPIFQNDNEKHYDKLRSQMVERQLKRRDVTDSKVLTAMGKVKRHLFVSKDLMDESYNDYPLPIGEGQTISQPYIVALMTQILNVKSGEKVLEIGTGSGYQAAILAELTDYVYTIEIKEKLAKSAKDRLNGLGYHNVNVKFGDGYYGWEEFAPFDAIIITAAANHISPSLVKQLKEGGRLLIPLGSTRYWQTLTMGIKRKGELMDIKHYTDVVFVPMTGEIQRKR
jgi:protein-L-isoaspartate(D-aspartate) O-methyltransferase